MTVKPQARAAGLAALGIAIGIFAGCDGATDAPPAATEQAVAGCTTIQRGVAGGVFADAQTASSTPDKSFGASQVGNAGTYMPDGSVRELYVSFGLPAFASCTSASLNLARGPVSPTAPGILLATPLTAAFGESTLTWNNAPGDTGVPAGSLSVTGAEASVSIDVTGYVNAALAAPATNLGLVIEKVVPGGGDVYSTNSQFKMSEWPTVAERPSVTLCGCQ